MARIFVVEDNESLRDAVVSYLSLNDHEVVAFDRVQGVLDAAATRTPDLLVLDVMLPDGNGFALARELRRRQDVPIVFLTARTAESDRITGFEVGGDDYVIKPFSPRELSLRVEAILRRYGRERSQSVGARRWQKDGHMLEIDEESHRAYLDGEEVRFTLAEWSILLYLAGNAGRVTTRETLLGECLDYQVAGYSDRTVDTHVKNIRAKISNAEWIETVRGMGYRFAGAPSEGPSQR
jgi:two-component system phosphate regulon response regulator PhoB